MFTIKVFPAIMSEFWGNVILQISFCYYKTFPFDPENSQKKYKSNQGQTY